MKPTDMDYVPRLGLLRIRSLIADKEMVAATANRELQQFGEWQCDHQEHHYEIDQQIEELIKAFYLEEITEEDEDEEIDSPPRTVQMNTTQLSIT